MKDTADKKTAELLENGTEKRARGRPAKHKNAAARQKAWRDRQRAAGRTERKVWVRQLAAGVAVSSAILDLSGNVRGALAERK